MMLYLTIFSPSGWYQSNFIYGTVVVGGDYYGRESKHVGDILSFSTGLDVLMHL